MDESVVAVIEKFRELKKDLEDELDKNISKADFELRLAEALNERRGFKDSAKKNHLDLQTRYSQLQDEHTTLSKRYDSLMLEKEKEAIEHARRLQLLQDELNAVLKSKDGSQTAKEHEIRRKVQDETSRVYEEEMKKIIEKSELMLQQYRQENSDIRADNALKEQRIVDMQAKLQRLGASRTAAESVLKGEMASSMQLHDLEYLKTDLDRVVQYYQEQLVVADQSKYSALHQSSDEHRALMKKAKELQISNFQLEDELATSKLALAEVDAKDQRIKELESYISKLQSEITKLRMDEAESRERFLSEFEEGGGGKGGGPGSITADVTFSNSILGSPASAMGTKESLEQSAARVTESSVMLMRCAELEEQNMRLVRQVDVLRNVESAKGDLEHQLSSWKLQAVEAQHRAEETDKKLVQVVQENRELAHAVSNLRSEVNKLENDRNVQITKAADYEAALTGAQREAGVFLKERENVAQLKAQFDSHVRELDSQRDIMIAKAETDKKLLQEHVSELKNELLRLRQNGREANQKLSQQDIILKADLRAKDLQLHRSEAEKDELKHKLALEQANRQLISSETIRTLSKSEHHVDEYVALKRAKEEVESLLQSEMSKRRKLEEELWWLRPNDNRSASPHTSSPFNVRESINADSKELAYVNDLEEEIGRLRGALREEQEKCNRFETLASSLKTSFGSSPADRAGTFDDPSLKVFSLQTSLETISSEFTAYRNHVETSCSSILNAFNCSTTTTTSPGSGRKHSVLSTAHLSAAQAEACKDIHALLSKTRQLSIASSVKQSLPHHSALNPTLQEVAQLKQERDDAFNQLRRLKAEFDDLSKSVHALTENSVLRKGHGKVGASESEDLLRTISFLEERVKLLEDNRPVNQQLDSYKRERLALVDQNERLKRSADISAAELSKARAELKRLENELIEAKLSLAEENLKREETTNELRGQVRRLSEAQAASPTAQRPQDLQGSNTTTPTTLTSRTSPKTSSGVPPVEDMSASQQRALDVKPAGNISQPTSTRPLIPSPAGTKHASPTAMDQTMWSSPSNAAKAKAIRDLDEVLNKPRVPLKVPIQPIL